MSCALLLEMGDCCSTVCISNAALRHPSAHQQGSDHDPLRSDIAMPNMQISPWDLAVVAVYVIGTRLLFGWWA
ncbi:MAG: hypothetical protein VBE63_20240, partial [Lamprobacter sp.]|uniref:hypothetical protein n=1 Tax=Lamprobacter sp. TaxID=3100796 RepID=UPI002B259553